MNKLIKTNIKEKSPEWFKLHLTTVTASRLYDLLKDPLTFINNKEVKKPINKHDTSSVSSMWWGRNLESLVLDKIKIDFPEYVKCEKPTSSYKMILNTHEYTASFDAINESNYIIEIKTVKSLGKYGNIKDHYGFSQCLWYHILTDLPVHLFLYNNTYIKKLGTIDNNIQHYTLLTKLLRGIMEMSNRYVKEDIQIKQDDQLIEYVKTYNNLLNPPVEKVTQPELEDILTAYNKVRVDFNIVRKEKVRLEAIIKSQIPDKQVLFDGFLYSIRYTLRKGNVNYVNLQKVIGNIKIDDYRGNPITIKAIVMKKVK